MTNEDQIWTLCINHDDIDYNNSSKIILEDAINKEINDDYFNWYDYISLYDDLKYIKNKEDAYYHWKNYGKKEGRISHNFKWTNYLLLNSDLIEAGINTESQALSHYIKHGKLENRKII